MSSPSLPDASLRASTLHLPAGPWSTVLDCLCARFPAIDRDTWLARMQRGRVLDAEGRALGPQAAYREGLRVHYFRELPVEAPIPFEARILYRDEHLLVADKPHFLPVMPAGGYVEQTLLARLARSTGNRDLVPLHRIDRHTAGLVLFSTNPGSRGRYQALFRERRIDKCYEAIARLEDGEAVGAHAIGAVVGVELAAELGFAGQRRLGDRLQRGEGRGGGAEDAGGKEGRGEGMTGHRCLRMKRLSGAPRRRLAHGGAGR